MRLGVLLVLLAACQGGGVEIVVYPPAEAGAQKPDEVRLYVGLGGGDATREQTPNFKSDAKHRGTLWSRDMDYDVATPASPDSAVHFTYAARGSGDTISVIAVGMTGGHPTSAVARYDLVVPTAHVAVYSVGLNPATVAQPQGTDNNEVELWGPKPGDTDCVQLIDDRADHDDPRYRVSFIASSGDEDCDGFRAGDKTECDDHAYKASVAPSLSTLSCISDDPIMTTPQGAAIDACRLGGLSCTDGDAAGRVDCSLDTRAYCAPLSLCARCIPEGDNAFECAIDPVGSDPTNEGLAYECRVPQAKTTGGTVACAATYSVTLSSAQVMLGCTNPLWHGRDKSDGWQTKVELGAGALNVHIGPNLAACQVEMETMTVPEPGDLPIGGLLGVDVAPTRGVVVPVVFVPDPQVRTGPCEATAPVQCLPRNSTLPPIDTFASCLMNAPPDM